MPEMQLIVARHVIRMVVVTCRPTSGSLICSPSGLNVLESRAKPEFNCMTPNPRDVHTPNRVVIMEKLSMSSPKKPYMPLPIRGNRQDRSFMERPIF